MSKEREDALRIHTKSLAGRQHRLAYDDLVDEMKFMGSEYSRLAFAIKQVRQ